LDLKKLTKTSFSDLYNRDIHLHRRDDDRGPDRQLAGDLHGPHSRLSRRLQCHGRRFAG
jgi:hypothetical protein